jgi:hypothetical protein
LEFTIAPLRGRPGATTESGSAGYSPMLVALAGKPRRMIAEADGRWSEVFLG